MRELFVQLLYALRKTPTSCRHEQGIEPCRVQVALSFSFSLNLSLSVSLSRACSSSRILEVEGREGREAGNKLKKG